MVVKYPPNMPPAIAPAPIKPNSLFASLRSKTILAITQNCDVTNTPNKEILT